MALIFVSSESDHQGSQVDRAEAMKEATYHLLPTQYTSYFASAGLLNLISCWNGERDKGGGGKAEKKVLICSGLWGTLKNYPHLWTPRWAAPSWQGWELSPVCRGGMLMLKYSVHLRSDTGS